MPSAMTYTLENSYAWANGSDKARFYFQQWNGWLQPLYLGYYPSGQIGFWIQNLVAPGKRMLRAMTQTYSSENDGSLFSDRKSLEDRNDYQTVFSKTVWMS